MWGTGTSRINVSQQMENGCFILRFELGRIEFSRLRLFNGY